MSVFRPLIKMWPCRMSWRAEGRLTAKPMCVMTLSSRRFEQGHQQVAGVPRSTAGHFVIAAELALEDAVVALDLLLLSQSDGVLARLAAAILLLSGRAVSALDRRT